MRQLSAGIACVMVVWGAAVMPLRGDAAPAEHISGCEGHTPPSGDDEWFGGCGDVIPEPEPEQEPASETPAVAPGPAPADAAPPLCIWVAFEHEGLEELHARNRPDDPDAYMVRQECRDPDVECELGDCLYSPPQGGFMLWVVEWVAPGEDGPDGEALLAGAMAELWDQMPQPSVLTNPVGERASIVNVPTFVHVENWTGTIEVEQCDGDYCIEAVAVPHMIFDPGEPGVEAIDCPGPGERYDRYHPMGDDPFRQADRVDTCTHTYTTATEGDSTFPASVTVVWDITWTPADVAGTPSVSLTEDIPRNVNEIRTAVTD